MMTLPKFLENAVAQLAPTMPMADWRTIRAQLTGPLEFPADMVDKHADEIRRLSRETCQGTGPISIPNTGQLPPSPNSESSLPQGRSHSSSIDSQVTNEDQWPTAISLLIKGQNGAFKREPIGCEWSEDGENLITMSALESRGLLSRMNVETQTIRLTWHRSQQPGKTYPNLFRIVADEDLPSADIRFGKYWMQGAPLEIDDTLGGKRKRNPGEVDEVEHARELTVQRTFVGRDMQDPVWVGAAMGQMLRSYVDGGGHPFPNQSGGNDSYNGHNNFHRQPD